MPSFIKNSVFNDIKPTQSGGIININDGNIILYQISFLPRMLRAFIHINPSLALKIAASQGAQLLMATACLVMSVKCQHQL